MLIVDAYRNLAESSASISKRFHVSDTYAHDVFDRYVKLDRLPLTDAVSVDEVFLDMDDNCKYALVIQDFHTGDPIDLLRSRRMNITEPYFTSIPSQERNSVKYLISDMYNPYISYVDKHFPNAVPVVDSFHVLQWVTRSIDNYMRQLLKKYKQRDKILFKGLVLYQTLSHTLKLVPHESPSSQPLTKNPQQLCYFLCQTLTKNHQQVWQTLKNFDYPMNTSFRHFNLLFKLLGG